MKSRLETEETATKGMRAEFEKELQRRMGELENAERAERDKLAAEVGSLRAENGLLGLKLQQKQGENEKETGKLKEIIRRHEQELAKMKKEHAEANNKAAENELRRRMEKRSSVSECACGTDKTEIEERCTAKRIIRTARPWAVVLMVKLMHNWWDSAWESLLQRWRIGSCAVYSILMANRLASFSQGFRWEAQQ